MASSSARKFAGIAAVGVMTLLVVAVSGCHRPAEETTPTEATVQVGPGAEGRTADQDESSTSSDTEIAGSAAMSEAELDTVLAALTQAVRRYGVEQRRVPASLDELVASGHLSQVPEAPRGKRFRINKQLQVYLANE